MNKGGGITRLTALYTIKTSGLLAANMGFCDFKDVVAFGNNQLWRPLAAKDKGHHSGLSQKMVSLSNSLLLHYRYNSHEILSIYGFRVLYFCESVI